MKKTLMFLMLLVLTFSMLAGCGCRNSKPAETTLPTTLPTMTTEATTQATTMPTTEPETTVGPTLEDGNGPLTTDSTSSTDETQNDNSRSITGGMTGNSGMTGSGNGITGSITG